MFIAAKQLAHFDHDSFFLDLILQVIFQVREKVKEFRQSFATKCL